MNFGLGAACRAHYSQSLVVNLHGANETPQLELCPWGYLRGEALGTRGASDKKTSALTRAWLRSLALLATSGVVAAQPTEMERMQQQLNQQVMDAPFSVEDQARLALSE